MPSSPRSAPTLLVLARYPREGQVKTRLAATLGKDRALRIYRAMLLDSIDRFALIPAVRRWIFLSGCSEAEGHALAACAEQGRHFTVAMQEGADLGARLTNALQTCGDSAGGFLILGGDSPTVPLDYLRRAGELLSSVPVVVGPALDGGYYLLALREARTDLFDEIEWGSRRVLDQTLSRLPAPDYVLLPPWSDIDTAHDLARIRAQIRDSAQWRNSRLRAALVDPDETTDGMPASNRE